MDKERKKRYEEKIELGLSRIDIIEETINEFENEKLKLASYKAFQEVVECVTDVIAMILIDKDKVVEDDYTNTEKIKEIVIFKDEEIKIIKEANGLRNRIIHKYNRTDDSIAKESIINLIPKLEIILNKFKKYIKDEK